MPHAFGSFKRNLAVILEAFSSSFSYPITSLVRWDFPSFGFIKLNTDGAAKGAPGVAACGGLFRNFQGNWILGFSTRIGICNAFVAELWGVWYGLNIAWHRGWRRLILESDSTSVVAVLSKRGGAARESRLLTHIRAILNRDWQVSITHAFREANSCADYLANLPIINPSLPDESFFTAPPAPLSLLLQADAAGTYHPRKGTG